MRRKHFGASVFIYMLILIGKQLAISITCLADQASLDRTSSFTVIRQVLPLGGWGAFFAVVGVGGIISLIADKELTARLVMVASSALSTAWMMCFILAGLQGDLLTIVHPIVWAALAAKDMIMASVPFNRPVESIVKEKLLDPGV